MNKIIIFLILSLFLVGCQQSQQFACETPYSVIGNKCCLDDNLDLICDDEQKIIENELAKNVLTGEATKIVNTTPKYDIIVTDPNPVVLNDSKNVTKAVVQEVEYTTPNTEEDTTETPTNEETTPITGGDPECVALGCPEGTSYVGSISATKYHKCSCRWAHEDQGGIKKENLNCFTDKADAESKGYAACKTCDP